MLNKSEPSVSASLVSIHTKSDDFSDSNSNSASFASEPGFPENLDCRFYHRDTVSDLNTENHSALSHE